VFVVMDTADETARAFIRRHPKTAVTGGGMSAGLELRANGAFCRVNAQTMENTNLSPFNSVLVTEIDNRILAGEVKLKLSEIYGDEINVFLRVPAGNIISLPIEDMDRLKDYDHRCACLVNPASSIEKLYSYDFEALVRLCRELEKEESETDGEALAQNIALCAKKLNSLTAYGEYTISEVMTMAAEDIKNDEQK